MSTDQPERHLLRVAVDIARPTEVVYDYLRDIKTRLFLNPTYHLTGFEWLTSGPPQPGSRYRVHAAVADMRMDYDCELIEQVENQRLATRGVDTGMIVRLRMDPNAGGCLLTHEEYFSLPEEVLEPDPGTERAILGNLLAALFGQRKAPLLEAERERRVQATLAQMEARLRHWLELVRDDIESKYPAS